MVNESVSKNCLTILSVNTFWVPDVIIKRYDVDLVCGSAETATFPRAYSIVSMNGPLRLWDWWSVLNNRIAVSPRTVKSPVGIKIWSGTVLVHKTGHVFIHICIIRKVIENTTNFVLTKISILAKNKLYLNFITILELLQLKSSQIYQITILMASWLFSKRFI